MNANYSLLFHKCNKYDLNESQHLEDKRVLRCLEPKVPLSSNFIALEKVWYLTVTLNFTELSVSALAFCMEDGKF